MSKPIDNEYRIIEDSNRSQFFIEVFENGDWKKITYYRYTAFNKESILNVVKDGMKALVFTRERKSPTRERKSPKNPIKVLLTEHQLKKEN